MATCPLLTEQDASTNLSSLQLSESPSFSNAFASAARHYIMPCGFGSSGGLAVLTTPGRDNVGGSIMCESDLCNMAGPIFGLPQSNLVLLGKADGVGSIVLRGVLREGESVDETNQGVFLEEFEEVSIGQSGESMDVDALPSFNDASDVLGKMTLLAASEFYSDSQIFSVFFVKVPDLESSHLYAIVIMSYAGENKESDLGLKVEFVHVIDIESNKSSFNNSCARGMLASITPMVSKFSGGSLSISSVTFGCVWASGDGSIFDIALTGRATNDDNIAAALPVGFEVSESVFVGDRDDDVDFYDSKRVVVR